jgi:exodeoxyribonuclease-5
VLADSRDTIALGALLRGPLVGLTEEQMLDIVWSLRDEDRPEQPGKLGIHVDPARVANELARDILRTLQSLRRQVNSTSPHLLLSQAVDLLRVRPILQQRHQGRAERALANVDKFLDLSRAYALQGMAAFAAATTLAWTDASRAPEGQPDAQEDAVTLYTMHSAKGLEWPVVVPINTMTRTQGPKSVFCERTTNRLCCPVFGICLPGYDADRDAESVEIERERVRLWYVAATRARELLVLPRLDVEPASAAWIALLDLRLADLPALDMSATPAAPAARSGAVNLQTQDVFSREAATIAAAGPRFRWRTPSRDEGASIEVVTEESAGPDVPAMAGGDADVIGAAVQGGRERGLVMHKLFEEVLTGETGDTEATLQRRAAELIGQITSTADRVLDLSANEIAGCVARTLSLEEIAPLRSSLTPEYWVYGVEPGADGDVVTAGIADAVSFSPDGKASVVVDWKSDVDPSPATLNHYKDQLSNYLAVTSAPRGLIVLVTSGRVIEVRTPTGTGAV